MNETRDWCKLQSMRDLSIEGSNGRDPVKTDTANKGILRATGTSAGMPSVFTSERVFTTIIYHYLEQS